MHEFAVVRAESCVRASSPELRGRRIWRRFAPLSSRNTMPAPAASSDSSDSDSDDRAPRRGNNNKEQAEPEPPSSKGRPPARESRDSSPPRGNRPRAQTT